MILGSVNYKLANPLVSSHLELVADLIESNTRKWKEYLITSMFSSTDAERILRISLAEEACNDKLAWMCEPSGEFSVKSSYKLLRSLTYTPINLQTDYKLFYKSLWITNLSSKIQILIWRLFKQYIPTLAILAKRPLVSNPCCPKCQFELESVEHIFWFCPKSIEVWNLLGFKWILDSNIEIWIE